MKRLLLLVWVVLGLWLTGCQKNVKETAETGRFKMQFTHVAGALPFSLNTSFTNAFGETFVATKYKYYITNISLTDNSNKQHLIPDTYFLVDESNAASKTLLFDVPVGTYKAVSFLIGVDSLRNVSGAQTGALDPLHDMFWTWNTGYVMAKLEGTSPQSSLPNQKIEYHTGGFKGEHSVLRTVTLPFQQAYDVQLLKGLQVNIVADVLKWFDGPQPVTIAAVPTATAPGVLASRLASNYARMFTLTSVQQQ